MSAHRITTTLRKLADELEADPTPYGADDPDALRAIAKRVEAHAGVVHLTCDMERDCAAPVTHIDEKGFVYCAKHGPERRHSGRRCRRLTPAELKQLRAGQPLATY